MALVDQLTDHRQYLASVLERQECRRRRVNAGGYSAQPVLGAAGPSSSRHGNGSLRTPSESESSRAGPSSLPDSGRSVASSRLDSQYVPRRALDSTGSSARQPSDDTPRAPSPTPSKRNVANYIPAEEAVRNDYAAWYGVSGDWPSNYVLGAGSEEICEEFPTLRRLMDLKRSAVDAASHPPLILPLPTASPSALQQLLSPHRFDVILVHPGQWGETAALSIRQLSADPGFVFLWVGAADSEGLERGRECLAKWGFRRAEDIVWVKTNKRAKGNPGGASQGIFASQKEHCLMGIRGTVRRSTDSHFVHCNVDTDVIVWEEDEEGGHHVPPYLYTLIENFCLGARRLEIFGDARRARRGWVTAAVAPGASDSCNLHPSSASSSRLSPTPRASTPPEPTLSSLGASEDALPFNGAEYASLLPEKEEGKPVVPFHAEIDALRPKSPQRRQARRNDGKAPAPRGGMGRGQVQPGGGMNMNHHPGMSNRNTHMDMNMHVGNGMNRNNMSNRGNMSNMNMGMGNMGTDVDMQWGMMQGQGFPNMPVMQQEAMYPQMGQMGQVGQMGYMGQLPGQGMGMAGMGGMMGMPGMMGVDMMTQMQQLQLAQMMAMQRPQTAFGNQGHNLPQLSPMQQGLSPNLSQGRSPNLSQDRSPVLPQGLSPTLPQGQSPRVQQGYLSPNVGNSPNPSFGNQGSPIPQHQQQEEEWFLQQQRQQQQMGQLAQGMGTMGMPYLGGEYYGHGYGYNG